MHKLSKAEWSELIAGWIEGFVTSGVIFTIILLSLGVELFVALIPILIVIGTGITSMIVGLTLIFEKRCLQEDESSY